MAYKKTKKEKKEYEDVVEDGSENPEDVDSLPKNELEKPILPKLSLDINALVNKAKNRFEKDDKKSMKRACDIVVSQDKKDYVTSDEIAAFWKPLTGVWGAPFGRIVQISGKTDSGKSTVGMMFVAAAQRSGVLAIIWDSEAKFDSSRLTKHFGGDPSQIPISTSKIIATGSNEILAYIRAAKEMDPKIKILILWDSVGSTLNSGQDSENDDMSKQPGVTAKENTWAIGRFSQVIEKYRDPDTDDYTIAMVMINQVYANIGSVGFVEKGGGGIQYLSSAVIQMTRIRDEFITRNGDQYKCGIMTDARVKKNHVMSGDDNIARMELFVGAGGVFLEKPKGRKKKSSESSDEENSDSEKDGEN
jgi:RecA/RadA recombinase